MAHACGTARGPNCRAPLRSMRAFGVSARLADESAFHADVCDRIVRKHATDLCCQEFARTKSSETVHSEPRYSEAFLCSCTCARWTLLVPPLTRGNIRNAFRAVHSPVCAPVILADCDLVQLWDRWRRDLVDCAAQCFPLRYASCRMLTAKRIFIAEEI